MATTGIAPLAPQPYSFRDPDSRVTFVGDRVVRYVRPELGADLRMFLSSRVCDELVSRGSLVSTEMNFASDGSALLEHSKVFFASYCWEWTRSMWLEAGRLTLELARTLLEHGFVLKDATPANILFQGTTPIFVDFGSIVRRSKGSPLWPAYAQFVRTFILPLLAERFLGWPLALTAQRRDGYEPAELYQQLGWISRLRRTVRSTVTLPVQLTKWIRSSEVSTLLQHTVDDAQAQKALRRCFTRLQRELDDASTGQRQSAWINYDSGSLFAREDSRAEKQAFVERALCQTRARTVLDVGANLGRYSRLAASAGASVVALERDVEACDTNFRLSCEAQSCVLPIAVDVARPSPAIGWNNEETFSFNRRAYGQFDFVLALAVVHHLLAIDQIPLAFIVDAFSRYARRFLLVEWVPPADPGFRELTHGRDALFAQLSTEHARSVFARRFNFLQQEQLRNGRWLWLMEKNVIERSRDDQS